MSVIIFFSASKNNFFCRNDVQAIDFLRKGSYTPVWYHLSFRLKISKLSCFIFKNKARNHMYISRINIMNFCCIIHYEYEWYLLWFFKNCDQQNLLPRSREKWLVKSIFREPRWEPILPFIFLSQLLILIRFQLFFLLLLDFNLFLFSSSLCSALVAEP